MDLSNDLISKFVKVTSDQSNKTKEGTAYGIIVEFENKMYVKLDGSDLLTPINSTSDVKDGERVTIMIKDHNAVVTGNITSPSASSGDVKRVTQDVTALGGEIAEFESIVAKKVGVDELDAEVARINDLIAGRATIEDLNATNAEIVNLQAKDAEIVNLVAGKAEIGELTATNAEIENLKAKDAEITSLVASKANISDLTVINADIVDLKAKDIETDNLIADKASIGELNAVKADITDLQADKADIGELNAVIANVETLTSDLAIIDQAVINKADITDLNASNANINILDAEVAHIQTLVNGNLTSDNIASLNLTSANTTIQNAMIKDAMIDSITASKIKSGIIDTNLVTIQSVDGSMILTGSVQQFKDENGVTRIQIGKDTGGNFTFMLYDESGTGVLIDEDGIKSSDAIADGLIVDAKVADNANIAGSKLDIASVITEVNNDNSTTIKSNKIYLDEQGQSLEVAFNSLKTQVETIQDVTIDGDLTSIVEQVQSNTTQIEANKEGISTLVAENVIRTEEISDLEGELQQVNTTLSNKYTSLEQNINGFKTTVSETYTTKSEFDNLEVGGRNLATLSNIQDYTGGNLSNNKYYSVEGTKIIAKNQPLNSSLIGFKVYTDNTFEYVASGYTDTSQVQIFFSCYDKNNVMIQDQKFYSKAVVDGKFILSFNNIPKDTYYFYMGIGDIYAANYFIDKLKIEKGNKATDYTPAPEDVQSNIDAVDDKFANYSTTSQMNSAINQKANEITSSVSQTYTTKTEFNNLAVGGRNYLTNSKIKGYTVTVGSPTVEFDETTCPNGMKITGDQSGTSCIRLRQVITSNGYWTVSFEMRGSQNAAAKLSMDICDLGGTTFYTTTDNTFKKFSFTVNVTNYTSDLYHFVDIYNIDWAYFYIRNMKVEKGNKATDWTPAPEDVQSQIDTINKNLQTYATKSELTQTNNSIIAKFSESGGYNLIRNSTGACGTTSGWAHSASSMGVFTNYNIGSSNGCCMYLDNGTTTKEEFAFSSRFRLKPNTTYRFTGYFNNYTKCPSFDVFVLSSTKLTDTDNSQDFDKINHIISAQNTNGVWKKYTVTFTTPEGVMSGYLRIDNNGYNSAGSAINRVHWNCLILTEGELEVPWSPHPSEVYDGITTIDKNGIKVSQSNYNGYTQMNANGFYVNNGSENVISITKDGSYFKGKVVITSGSTVPTSVLSGTISSSQLNSSITSDISTAKSNASTAVSTANTASTNASTAVSTANTAISTANTASTNASNAVKTANTASTNASTAVSTANTAKSTADTAKSTVDSGKTNWDNAYNRVNEWAYGAVTGSTTIDGAYIQANTILASKLALMDFANYSQLNEKSASSWGFSYTNETTGTVYTMNSISRDKFISETHLCNGGEKFRIKGTIATTCKGYANTSATSATYLGTAIGVYCYNGNGASVGIAYSTRVTATSSGTETTIDSTVTIPSTARKFRIFVQTEGSSNFSGTIKLRNIQVLKMNSAEMIVDGAITANKIAADAITGKTIKGGSISGSTITGNTITGGTISGTSISGTKFTSAGTDGNSGQYQTMTLNSGALMMTGAIAGGTNDGQEAYRTYLTSMGLIVKDSSQGGFGGNANALYTNTGIYWNSKTTGGEEYPGWQQLIGYYNDYVLIDRLPLRVSNKIYNPGICTNYTNFYVSPASNGEVKIVTYDSDWGAANDQMTFRPIRASAFYRSDGKSAYINGSGNANLANASALVANGVKADSTDFFVGVNGRVRVTNTAGYNSGNGLTYKPIMASAFENGSDLMFKKNIRTTDDLDVIDILNKVDVYRYDMIGGNENEIGLIAQVCPSDLISGTPYDMDIQMANEITDEDRQALVDPDNGGASVNLYHMASILWKVCKEQQKRIERLEKSMKGEE